VKVGDLVRIKSDDPQDTDGTGYGIVIAFEQRGYQLEHDPDCDVWNDAIVIWPRFGKSWHMRALLEVISENR